jgi:hypothetical protein
MTNLMTRQVVTNALFSLVLFSASSAFGVWRSAPTTPSLVGEGDRPTVVLLTATWCQWCKVLKAVSLSDRKVRAQIKARWRALEVDVDRAPTWMDLDDVAGLPALVFFDRAGRHVLTKSGYREPDDLAALLDALADRIEAGKAEPYASRAAKSRLGASIDPARARAALTRIDKRLYFLVNDTEGGFRSPARLPYPGLLVELARWRAAGGPARAERWLDRTRESALRGTSPRLDGAPLDGMVDAVTLKRARGGGPRWFELIEELPEVDPWRGLQDPVDHGVFRYAAAAGWVHPHFERRATDNLAWIELLRMEGDPRADPIARFVARTFARGDGLASSQTSDPFYYRLRADERRGLKPPAVDELRLVEVQAAAARVDPARCSALPPLAAAWPDIEVGSGKGDAPPDVVGELLAALRRCGHNDEARDLAGRVVLRWRAGGLTRSPRLHALARGVCDAAPSACGAALAAVEDIEVDPQWPPALTHFQRWASR